ncbi:hypothetical protein QO004_004313 [Rhizobium mesoamericanum]|uniref:hypothetical protein n=1 Tax=Rhizobium mesoamericanum TaxID=1079800 RepID=UPI0027811141|nr:hypothetical protein [Rhizobium mesoamericanum]MDQ0562508.1 hypothetical protein [Rhizobium mesoamericanum]
MMTTARYAGLVLAPAIWAINMQLGLVLPYADCGSKMSLTVLGCLVAILLAIGSALISRSGRASTSARTTLFLCDLSFLTGLIFAFALILQGVGSWLLDACQR